MEKAIRPGQVVGQPEIDREHQLQIVLVDAFEKAAGSHERVEAGVILEQMADLSEMHFLAEELVMQHHQYPAYQAHAREHATLLEEIHLLVRQNAAGTLDITLDLAARLRQALADHMRGTDYALSTYMREEGIVESKPGGPPS